MKIRDLFFQHLAQTSEFASALEVSHAKGVEVFDSEGKSYLDFISGFSVSNIGHSHPKIIEAVNKQMQLYTHVQVYGEYSFAPQVLLAKKIVELLNSKLNSVYFVSSGSEAVEGAIKLAKKYTGRNQIIAFKNAYHGGTTAALSLTGDDSMKVGFGSLMDEVIHLEFNSVTDLEVISEKTAAVILEPIQTEAGIVMPKPEFVEALNHFTKKHGALLIADEIQTGIGRSGEWFYHKKIDLEADIVLLAKALGGGMPIGAFIAEKQVMAVLSKKPILGHITTFGGHPVSCAAALAAIEIIEEEKLIENAVEMRKIVSEYLIHEEISNLRGEGLLLGFNLDAGIDVKNVMDCAMKNGLLIDGFLFDEHALRIAPPLSISESELKNGLDILMRCL